MDNAAAAAVPTTNPITLVLRIVAELPSIYRWTWRDPIRIDPHVVVVDHGGRIGDGMSEGRK